MGEKLNTTGRRGGMTMFLPVRIVAVLSVCAVLAGCFQVETTVRVNPDGSGTVEEKMLLNGKMVEQMDQMAKAFSEPEEKAEPFSLYDPKKLRERAAGMGAGVSYVSGEPVEEKGFKGYRAIYSFKDINKLKLSQKSDGPMSETTPSKDGSEKPIQFRFTPGREARLVVIQPRAEKKPEQPVSEATQKPAKEERAAMTPDQEKAMEEMLKGMKFSLAIEVNGTIRDSNATYRDGNRITVFEFNPGSMVMDAKKLELLKKAEPASPEEAKEILKALPGFKMELNDPLEVVFSR
jgi:hypothetical protein